LDETLLRFDADGNHGTTVRNFAPAAAAIAEDIYIEFDPTGAEDARFVRGR
jgi:hypothetical protein